MKSRQYDSGVIGVQLRILNLELKIPSDEGMKNNLKWEEPLNFVKHVK